MNPKDFYSIIFTIIGFAIVLFFTDIVLSRIFPLLHEYIDKNISELSLEQKRSIERRINIIILTLIATLIISVVIINPKPVEISKEYSIRKENFHKVEYSRTTEKDFYIVPSIWEINKIEEAFQPSLQEKELYSPNLIFITGAEEFRWNFHWCDSDKDILQKSLAEIKVNFIVDSTVVPSDEILEYDETKDVGYCHYWSTTLRNWEAGSLVSFIVIVAPASGIFLPSNEYRKLIDFENNWQARGLVVYVKNEFYDDERLR